jgi:hypothetical protein
MTDKRRTRQQQDAIEVACRLLADEFDARGLDKLAVLSEKVIPVPWNQDSVKEDLFKSVMKAICYDDNGEPKTSTTQLSTKEVSEVWDRLMDFTDSKWGIRLPFPSNQPYD